MPDDAHDLLGGKIGSSSTAPPLLPNELAPSGPLLARSGATNDEVPRGNVPSAPDSIDTARRCAGCRRPAAGGRGPETYPWASVCDAGDLGARRTRCGPIASPTKVGPSGAHHTGIVAWDPAARGPGSRIRRAMRLTRSGSSGPRARQPPDIVPGGAPRTSGRVPRQRARLAGVLGPPPGTDTRSSGGARSSSTEGSPVTPSQDQGLAVFGDVSRGTDQQRNRQDPFGHPMGSVHRGPSDMTRWVNGGTVWCQRSRPTRTRTISTAPSARSSRSLDAPPPGGAVEPRNRSHG
jgi:hypothetical protein